MKHRPIKKKKKRTKLDLKIEKSVLDTLPKKHGRLSKKERLVRRVAFRTARLRQIDRNQIRLAAELEEGRWRNELSFDMLNDLTDRKRLDELSTTVQATNRGGNSKRQKTSNKQSEESAFTETEENPTHPEVTETAKSRHQPLASSSMKFMLPIKTISGKVIPVVRTLDPAEDLKENPDEETELCASKGKKQTSDEDQLTILEASSPTNLPELFAKRHRLMTVFKNKIASACNAVVLNPENNIGRLKEVLEYAAGMSDPLVKLTIQKLALVSLNEVFIDIIPQYRIREVTEKERAQKLSKETKELWAYEENLLNKYKKYLQIMEKIVKGRKYKSKAASAPSENLCVTTVACYGALLAQHPYFNFRNGIIIVLVPLMSSKNDKVRVNCCDIFKRLFDNDVSGEISLEAVRAINQFVRKNIRKLHPDLLETLLKLKITHVERSATESIKEKINRRKRMMRVMSRSDRKHFKRVESLKRELEEAEVETRENVVLQNHTKIITSVFHMYFRLLRNSLKAKLLLPVLEGLSKFAHLIGVEFFDDLVAMLYDIATASQTSSLESLFCLRTVSVILSSEGQALNVDTYRFQQLLYSLLPKVISQTEKRVFVKQYHVSLDCLDMMINQQKKNIPLNRVAGFVKRLSGYLLKMDTPVLTATLVAMCSYFRSHPKLECLVDDEEFGSGNFNKGVDDLEHCNALGSTVRSELRPLQHHRSADVRQLATHLLHRLPVTGPYSMPVRFISSNGVDLLKSLVEESLKNS